jgi:hypothetical protein
MSEFLQKRRFGLRKPPFYPLNYGDGKKGKSKKDEVRSPAACAPKPPAAAVRDQIFDFGLADFLREFAAEIPTQYFLFRSGSASVTFAR